MKVKITTGKGFAGVVKYATGKQQADFIGGTAPDAKSFLFRTAQLRAQRPDCKTPVLHFSLSQPEGERLTDQQWQAATDQLLTGLGLQDHDYIFVRHSDTQHDHIHVIASKISPAGKIWNERNSAKRSMKIVSKIEQKLGLTKTKTLAEFQQETGHRRNIIRDGETNEFRRTGKVKSKVEIAIQKRKATKNEQNRNSHNQTERGTEIMVNGETANQKQNPTDGKNTDGDGKTDQKVRNRVGAIISRADQETIVFFVDGEKDLLAKFNADRTAIEFFYIDLDMIDKAVEMAKRTNQIPLKIYGTHEFIAAAEARADHLKVAIHDRKTPPPAIVGGIKYAPPVAVDQRVDRLQNKLAAVDLSVKVGNIKKGETEWRYPAKVKEWITDELKRDPTVKAEDLLDIAKEDNRITAAMITETIADRNEATADDQPKEETQKWKM
jgi:hypothetical protein